MTDVTPGRGERSLTLYIPGLFSPVLGEDGVSPPSFPGIEAWLARADRADVPTPGLEAGLFRLFGHRATPDADLPVAAVLARYEIPDIGDDWWIRADPVHLYPARDRLILVDASLVPLSEAEAHSFVQEITGAFAEEGWRLHVPHPCRWYLRLPRGYRLETTPLSEVAGRDIHPYLPRGAEGREWRRWLNEVQLLLHASPANAEREARGDPAINSVWFWGGGYRPTLPAASWATVYSAEPLGLALGQLTGAGTSPIPGDYAAWFADARSGASLVVLDRLHLATCHQAADDWKQAAATIERDWVAPAYAAIRAGRIAGEIVTERAAFPLSRAGARRWWRRRRPLMEHA